MSLAPSKVVLTYILFLENLFFGIKFLVLSGINSRLSASIKGKAGSMVFTVKAVLRALLKELAV